MKKGKQKPSRRALRRLFVFALLLAVAVTGVYAAGGAEAERPTSIHFMMGPMGGSMYPVGALMGDILFQEFPNVRTNVSPGGSISNIIAVDQGSAQIGHTTSEMAASAWDGMEPFEQEHKNIRGLFSIQPMGVQFVIAADRGISSLAQVKQQRVPLRLGLNPPGNVSTMLAELILEEHGISLADIQDWGGSITYGSHTDLASSYRDRHIDAMVLYTSIPAPAFVESDLARDLKLIQMDDAVVSYLNDLYGLEPINVARGTFRGMTDDATALQGTILLVISNELPEQLVYEMMKTWFAPENFQRLTGMNDHIKSYLSSPAAAAGGMPIPMHPGSEKFFKEIGAID